MLCEIYTLVYFCCIQYMDPDDELSMKPGPRDPLSVTYITVNS